MTNDDAERIVWWKRARKCPFCGKRKSLEINYEKSDGMYWVWCDYDSFPAGCGASGPAASTIAGAVAAWNEMDIIRRSEEYTQAQLDAQREIMIEHIQGIIDDGQSDGDTINAIRDYLSDVDVSGVV